VVEEAIPTSDIVTPEPGELSPDDSRQTYVRNTAVMTVGTALSRLTGFLRIAAQAAALGVTGNALADTYNRANTTPNILYELALGGILTSVFVPLFVEWNHRHGREESWAVADRILTLSALGLSAIAILAGVFAPWIIRLYTSASHAPDRQQQLELGTFFLRWFMPQIVFYGIGAVLGGLLNARRRFAAPMFAPILNNLVVVLTFGTYSWLLHQGSPGVETITGPQKYVLAVGTTLGVLSMTVALWPSVRAAGYRWHPRLDWNHPALHRLARLAGWVVVYVVANQLAFLVIIILAGRVQGGISGYAYAFIVFSLPHAIFAVSIFTALLPGMSARWTAGDPDGVRLLFSRGVRDTAVVILPAALGYVALALPISRLLFEHGHAQLVDARLIASTLRAFAVGLPFFSTFQLLTRTFYAMQDTRTPALVNIAAALVNVGADLLFMLVLGLGVPGLALGHATSYVFASVVSLVILRRRLGGLDGGRIGGTLARVVPSSALAAGTALLVTLPFGDEASLTGLVLEVVLAVGAGVLVFVAAALMFKISEVDDVVRAVRGRFGR
jgi:putative peptidoglycan lipid II flippase